MTMNASFTLKIPGTPQMTAERDRIVGAYAEARAMLPDGAVLLNPDLHACPGLVMALDEMVTSARQKLTAVAKKGGFHVPDNPDVRYGMHVSGSGPVECWFQISV